MLNFIKAELYKQFKLPLIYVINAVLVAGLILVCLSFNGTESDIATKGFILERMGGIFPIIAVFLTVFTSVFLDDYRYGTLKNIMSSDISRSKYYIGKLIVQTIMGLITSAVCLIALFIGLLLLPSGDDFGVYAMSFLLRCLCVIPVYIALLSFIDLLVVMFKKGTVYLAYYLVPFALSIVLGILSSFSNIFEKLKYLSIGYALIPLTDTAATNEQMIYAVVLGIFWTIVFTGLGLTIFKNREIK
ncbi:ABC transporter permease [Clostridium sardiniense]|uniref:ABC transporter permease n=1 Tax=Clostridium sardiniense TaxID=29369 RepID=UPI00195D0C6E|nr:ABC transporter permease [Clostridium sardiniense]MBM7834681.1 ABC-2 type transport system permease protein [Clostridium sardiniense]